MARRKTTKLIRTPRKKKTYEIDGIVYNSKPLHDYHIELKSLLKEGLIKSFSLPDINSVVRSKYHAYKATINDITFDSLDESRFYIHLLRRMKEQGDIKKFDMQVPFELIPSYTKNGHKIRRMDYVADFVIYYADGHKEVIDVKGIETEVFKLKKKIFEYRYKDLSLICYKYVHKTWMTTKEYKKYLKEKKTSKKTA